MTSIVQQSDRQNSVVRDTLDALVDDVNATTDILRKRINQQTSPNEVGICSRSHVNSFQTVERRQFSATMDISGRMSVSPGPNWNEIRLKSISNDDMRNVLDKVKHDQRQNAVVDTLAALVYDVNATAEVLRRGSLKRKKPEVEYRLRITPEPDNIGWEQQNTFPSPRPPSPNEDVYTLERVHSDYGVDVSDTTVTRKRTRSETPRRTIQIESTPPPQGLPICAFCNDQIDGAVITALAPNSIYAQKFHTYHFMCTYCQKALNLRGTYREHDRKPYCHECFYRLYSGLIYSPDEKQKSIQKLI